ncbi:MAG: Protein-L-isoaspartate(D-aspartate) O-methyltransferase [Parcubacteria group bacterium GW2011_GWA2_46_7]|nr:MAG: Protein-L-isoaspartate(D-aspartate) O-methyltransferase [Parcubacteria group bacterium GW2011_GWF1_45_5]KKU44199.1 MAG: Protein-L-isoaspartate(D-aspartate) O-methyltransferase [Parcubacteria group bacterium GW2011_GWA2_46_7]
MTYELYMSHQDLVTRLIQSNVLKTSAIIDAFKKIDRKDFVLEAFADEAYGNYPISIGGGQTISQPWTVAFMLELLNPLAGDRVLDIGSGSGWTTALLAHIVKDSKKQGKVFGIEIVPELCIFGEKNCEKYKLISSGAAFFYCGDATGGVTDQAPFDKILCSAALQTTELPQSWKDQLRIGGRMVVPMGNSIFAFDKVTEKDFIHQEYEGFAFVPFITSQNI